MSVWGKPLLPASANLAAPLILGGSIADATGEYSYTGDTNVASTPGYMPVNFAEHPYLDIAWTAANLPSSTRMMVFAYNADRQFMGRTSGNSTNPRSINSASGFSRDVTSAPGPIAYVRIRFYYATFTAEQINSAELRVYTSDVSYGPTPNLPRGIRFIS